MNADLLETVVFSETAVARAVRARRLFADIYIPTKAHKVIHGKCEILRLTHQGRHGHPMTGLRLSELSSAGKTTCFTNYRTRILTATAAATGEVNPYQIVMISLSTVITPKMLCQEILRSLGDPNFSIGNTDLLIQRMREFIVKCGVELLIIDEVQHLRGNRTNRQDVSDQLKNLLEKGIVPIVFVGNEHSRELFERDIQLANRTGTPLQLDPIHHSNPEDRTEFKRFCVRLEAEMIKVGILERNGILSASAGIKELLKWSGGHLGRVSRIVDQALEISALRNAATIEHHDLRQAIETFAMPNGYRS